MPRTGQTGQKSSATRSLKMRKRSSQLWWKWSPRGELQGFVLFRSLKPLTVFSPFRSSKLGSSPLAESGLRQRLALADELDSSPASPGARKAIHSYKITETTRQVTTRSKDGTETVDTKHSVERSESQGLSPSGSRSLFSRLAYPLLKLAILLTLPYGGF